MKCNKEYLLKQIVMVFSVACLSACNTTLKRDIEFAPARPAAIAAPSINNGSIYQPGFGLLLFADRRAKRVGDNLTIRLVEKTKALTKAETTFEKDNSFQFANPTVFGRQLSFKLPNGLPGRSLSNGGNFNLSQDWNSELEFEGTAESKQSNSLTGDITVTVIEVYPNGNLFVRGEKRLMINQSIEYVRISGIIRPADIGLDNSVSSSKVADATIHYVGDGPMSNSNKMGWLSRFFLSDFFPF